MDIKKDEKKRRNLIIISILSFMGAIIVVSVELSVGYKALFLTMILGLLLISYKKLKV